MDRTLLPDSADALVRPSQLSTTFLARWTWLRRSDGASPRTIWTSTEFRACRFRIHQNAAGYAASISPRDHRGDGHSADAVAHAAPPVNSATAYQRSLAHLSLILAPQKWHAMAHARSASGSTYQRPRR